MNEKLRVHVTHVFEPDPEAVRRAIELLVRLSDEARARKTTLADRRKVEVL